MIDDDDSATGGTGPGSVGITLPRNLEPMSIDALHKYIAVLEGEIARVRQDIEAKHGLRSAADKFFRSDD